MSAKKKKKFAGTNLTEEEFKELAKDNKAREAKLWLKLEERNEAQREEALGHLSTRDRLMRLVFTKYVDHVFTDDLGEFTVRTRIMMDYETENAVAIIKRMQSIGNNEDEKAFDVMQECRTELKAVAKGLVQEEWVKELFDSGIVTDDIVQTIIMNCMMGASAFMSDDVGKFRTNSTRTVLPRAKRDPEADTP